MVSPSSHSLEKPSRRVWVDINHQMMLERRDQQLAKNDYVISTGATVVYCYTDDAMHWTVTKVTKELFLTASEFLRIENGFYVFKKRGHIYYVNADSVRVLRKSV